MSSTDTDTLAIGLLRSLPASVRLVEVGLRDGLQVVPGRLPLEVKVDLVQRMLDAGVRHIEVASFAHPEVLPQLADAEELLAAVPRTPGVEYRALVPNLRGAKRAAECDLHTMVALTCADEDVAQLNQGRGVDEILAELPAIGAVCRETGTRLVTSVAMAFFAAGRGRVSTEDRMRCVDAAVDAGATGVCLACSTGMEEPREVAEGVDEVRARYPQLEVGVHLHARNGMGLANALAAMSAGATWLEGSFGGLGGDLWAPGPVEVLGNVPFEDLVHFTDSLGITTGIDLKRYLPVVAIIESYTGWTARSAVVAGGTRAELIAHRWVRDQNGVAIGRPQREGLRPAAEGRSLAMLWLDSHNRNDPAALGEMLAEDIEIHSLFRSEPARGREHAIQHFRQTMSTFPDLVIDPVADALSADGTQYFAHVRFRGHFTGPWGAGDHRLMGSGQKLDVAGTVILSLNDNGVRSVRTLFDKAEWLAQMGMEWERPSP